jgi:hypothetical protein
MRSGGFFFLHPNITLLTHPSFAYILTVELSQQQTPIVLCQDGPEPKLADPELVVPDPQTRTSMSAPGEAKKDVQLRARTR